MNSISRPLLGQPKDDDGPVFREPWEAHAFAMTISLQERGVFSWSEWAQALSQQIALAQDQGDPDLGDAYYLHLLAALESLVTTKQVSSEAELKRYHQAWDYAADRTPHGRPVELQAKDFRA